MEMAFDGSFMLKNVEQNKFCATEKQGTEQKSFDTLSAHKKCKKDYFIYFDESLNREKISFSIFSISFYDWKSLN